MGRLPDVSILMWDYNDAIWHTPCLDKRYWHPLVESSQLVNLLYAFYPAPSRTQHT